MGNNERKKYPKDASDSDQIYPKFYMDVLFASLVIFCDILLVIIFFFKNNSFKGSFRNMISE